VGEVEARVRELESMIEQGRCGNLAEEKRTIQEIKQLNQMKNTINQYQVRWRGWDSKTWHRADRVSESCRNMDECVYSPSVEVMWL
jgi:hypothetical protein